MSFASFMQLALYHPDVGYYRKAKPRVGYAAGTDYFTSSTSGELFGQLVAAACSSLLQAAGRSPRSHVFVEIGAEPGGATITPGVRHEFQEVKVVRVGEPFQLAGDCVIFSNELFDAQPCIRSVFRSGSWTETGVELRDNLLREVDLNVPPPCTPVASVEGYRFDQPHAGAALAERIAEQPWRGLFIAFDYGKTFRELTEETPGGTARAYYRHTQSNDLLARPGEQDLTCHVCWDWMSEALRRNGFAAPRLDFQESFFIHHAGEFIAAVSAADAAGFSSRKLGLLQLLHPSHLGQKFQVLHALR